MRYIDITFVASIQLCQRGKFGLCLANPTSAESDGQEGEGAKEEGRNSFSPVIFLGRDD